jgi:hypothetical protein
MTKLVMLRSCEDQEDMGPKGVDAQSMLLRAHAA